MLTPTLERNARTSVTLDSWYPQPNLPASLVRLNVGTCSTWIPGGHRKVGSPAPGRRSKCKSSLGECSRMRGRSGGAHEMRPGWLEQANMGSWTLVDPYAVTLG